MRKILFLCLLILSLANIMNAAENLQTQTDTKVFNITYTAQEASQILEETFSNEYFNEQYEKLALLQRCELNLKTVPLAILDLDKYATLENDKKFSVVEYLGLEDAAALQENLRIDKLGKNKIITIVHYYSQADNIVTAYTSLASVQDTLQLFTTINKEAVTTEKNLENEKSSDKNNTSAKSEVSVKTTAKDSDKEEALKIKNLKLQDMPAEKAKTIWREHCKNLKKSLKTQ